MNKSDLKMPELRPCPFCGGKAVLFANDSIRVLCPDCGASSKILSDAIYGFGVSGNATASVIEAWNRRANNE